VAEHKSKSAAARSSVAQAPAELPPPEERFSGSLKEVVGSKEPSAVGSRLGDMIHHLLEYALEENLRPALDRLGGDFERQMNASRAAAVAESQEKMETFFSSFNARLEIKALDVLTQTEQAMEKRLADGRQAMKESLELQQQEAAQLFSDSIRVRLMQMVVNEEDRMRKEMSEAIAASVAETQEKLMLEIARFTEQVRNRGDEMAAAANAKVKVAEDDLNDRLRRFEEIGTRLTTQLEQRSEQVVSESTARLKSQMEDATTRVHQSFMRHIVTELSGKQANFVEEAMKPLEEAAEQNLRRMRKELTRMVKEVGQRFVGGTDDDS
jgi:hypothetical protein